MINGASYGIHGLYMFRKSLRDLITGLNWNHIRVVPNRLGLGNAITGKIWTGILELRYFGKLVDVRILSRYYILDWAR